ncbi:hypothetical protein TRVA0_003S01970 [Trichomonascus vanleenenianus]|uniref:protein kinase activating protein DPB11 n=1 Tax=Trichomonascus vanleenenianus TaxID=2268995 RepID=UPI003ECB887C
MSLSDGLLAGKVICCTQVEPEIRDKIYHVVETLGGVFSQHLSEDVTHLVVGGRNTPKYQFAVRQRGDMVFLKPAFLPALFENWQKGDEFRDIDSELAKGKLGVFEGCSICFTNIEAGERRELIDLIRANGAEFTKDLIKDSTTHLVTDGMSGKKLEFARKWGQHIVTKAWVHDSIRRGAALREDYYHPDLPEDRIGKDACIEWPEDNTPKKSVPKEKPAPRKPSLRLSKKRNLNPDEVWGVVNNDDSIRRTKASKSSEDSWIDTRQPENTSSIISANNPSHTSNNSGDTSGRIFEHFDFTFYGFTSKQDSILKNTIESLGGMVRDSIDDVHDFVIISSSMAPASRPQPKNAAIATEWMIERSMHLKSLTLDIWGTPLEHHNVPGFDCLNIHYSGYSGIEELHLSRMIKLLGANHEPIMEVNAGRTNSTDIVIMSKAKGRRQKILLCQKHKIPMVTETWLFKCAEKGFLVPLDEPECLVFQDQVVHDKFLRRRSAGNAEPSPATKRTKNDGFQQPKRLDDNKRRKTKLLGKAMQSNMKTQTETQHFHDESNEFEDEPEYTQVSYLNPESISAKKQLMAALGEDPELSTTGNVEYVEDTTPAIEAKKGLATAADRPRRNLRNRNNDD